MTDFGGRPGQNEFQLRRKLTSNYAARHAGVDPLTPVRGRLACIGHRGDGNLSLIHI